VASVARGIQKLRGGLMQFVLLVTVLLCACQAALGHAPPIYIPVPPLRVEGPALVDSTGTRFLMRGVEFPALDLEAVNPITYRLIRQRWNSNTVRIPVQMAKWREDRAAYLDRAAKAIGSARGEGLIVVLAPADAEARLPPEDLAAFWTDCAIRFAKDTGVVFSLFNEPDPRLIPSYTADQHRAADWEFWRNGGTLSDGRTVLGMQSLIDTIRGAGSANLIAASGFHDRLEFQGLTADHHLQDAGLIYEVHPSYDHGLTDEQREANFGFLRAKFPLYAGAWGMPLGQDNAACRVIPQDPVDASTLVFQTLSWFDIHDVSWTASVFNAGSLLREFDEFAPTELSPWTCDGVENPKQPGIGTTILLWTTGDPLGFGSILPEFVANLAGGPALPLAPGGLIALFGQGLGPDDSIAGQIDPATGTLAAQVAGVRLFFDGYPAPIVLANSYQVYAQVPYEVAGQMSSTVQLYYQDVPSNRIQLEIVPAAVELFTKRGSISDAVARHAEDGTENTTTNAALSGSVVVLEASGAGPLSPAVATGALVGADFSATPVQTVTATVAGKPAEVVSSRAAAGQIGRLEIAIRIPAEVVTGTPQRAQVILRSGAYSSRPGVFIWVK
jgi:uncharacterized protein (TIGR03437 family)